MGSYITIVNDTHDEWKCKLVADEKAVKVGSILAAAVSLFGAQLSVSAKAWPILTGEVDFAGLKAAQIVRIGKLTEIVGNSISVVGATSGLGLLVVRYIDEEYVKRGYNKIEPGTFYRYGKFVPKYWRQCTCVRSYTLNEGTVRTETLKMRPLFAGRPGTSRGVYNISMYLKRNKSIIQDTVLLREPVEPDRTRYMLPTVSPSLTESGVLASGNLRTAPEPKIAADPGLLGR